MTHIYTAVEDDLSDAVARRLAQEAGLTIDVSFNKSGSGAIKKKLPQLVKLAPNIPVFVLTDLDRVECAPKLVDSWFGPLRRPKSLVFRVAVREVESWILADKKGFSELASIPVNKIPDNPELLDDPKQVLLNLVSRYSKGDVKRDLVVDHGSGPKQGIEYNLLLGQYVLHAWDLRGACNVADSLNRTFRRLKELRG